MRDTNGSVDSSGVEIESSDSSVQNLAPPNNLQRFEGIAFSTSGNIIGVATSDTNTVFLFRRKPDGSFEDAPYWSINGPASGLNYPHDLSFSLSGDTELLAVAQRAGSISIYEKNRANDNYGTDPAFEIRGPETGLDYTDGVAFVPPNNDYLAACNLKASRIVFYRKAPGSSIGFNLEPDFELKYGVFRPDGLAFSQCGTWLAVANHGNHTVSIYKRRKPILSRLKLKYGPRPVTIIKDPGFRYPHSVAFTPETNHLVVTNAGANYFSVYGQKGAFRKCAGLNRQCCKKLLVRTIFFKKLTRAIKWKEGPKELRSTRTV